MVKRIFKEFVLSLMIVVFTCAFIFYVVVSNILLSNTKDAIFSTLYFVDHSLNYEQIMTNPDIMYDLLNEQPERFTIITKDGTVLFDTDVDKDTMLDNHLSREEIDEAFSSGKGDAIRYSYTLQQNMLYVAILCESGEYVYRAAVPYDGINSYYPQIVPLFLIVIGISFVLALIFSNVFSKSISEPLREISKQMVNFREKKEVKFQSYRDEELCNIVNTTESMMKEIEAQLLQLRKEKKIRQEFFSNASHELKTPLTSIRGYMELLDSGVITDSDKKKDFYKRILKEADGMTQLINDILMISKLETLDIEVVESPVNLQEVCHEVAEQLAPLANEQQVTINVSCENKTVVFVYQHIRHVLENLMSNAVKYNREGGYVHVDVFCDDHQLIIQVEDNGLGIKKEDNERVFERFYRQDKGRSKRVGGTGLGLSIVKHIVQYHQGHIRLTSKENVGTMVTVYMPLKENSL